MAEEEGEGEEAGVEEEEPEVGPERSSFHDDAVVNKEKSIMEL